MELYMTIFDLPRLSVDIDIDYSKDVSARVDTFEGYKEDLTLYCKKE